MASATNEMIAECKRLAESCLYTSTTLFIWLRCLRWFRVGFVIFNVLCGGLAGWSILKGASDASYKLIGAVFALLAGVLPAIYAALKADDGLAKCTMLAGEFKNLQNRFRQAAMIDSKGSPEDFAKVFQRLMDRFERARGHSYTAPEWCFTKAQRKIKMGHYDFDVDGEAVQSGKKP